MKGRERTEKHKQLDEHVRLLPYYINDLISLSLDCDGFKPAPLLVVPFDVAFAPRDDFLLVKKTFTAPLSISRNQ